MSAGAGGDYQLVFYAFDIPYLNGYDLTQVPLVDRKTILKRLLKLQSRSKGPIRYSDHLSGDASAIFAHACKGALEGLVGKRKDSSYEQKRSSAWIKLKCRKRQEFVIGGWTDPGGSRSGLGALLVGYYGGDHKLHYCGKVGTGFTAQTLIDLHKRLEPLATDQPAFSNAPRGRLAASAHWVQPQLVGEVEFNNWTTDGNLRHAAFLGLREDKKAKEVKREIPVEPPAARPAKRSVAAHRTARTRTPANDNSPLAQLTNPDRVFYPDKGYTKRDLAEYYLSVASSVLPHLVGRPLSIVRCPEGWQSERFFQKHRTQGMPRTIRSIKVREKNAVREWLAVDDEAGLVGLVQLGTLEIHPWGSRQENLDLPDRLIFDLDPGEGVRWGAVIDAAREVKQRLQDWKLDSFVRTTGGKGLHVVVPISPRATWDELKLVARGFAFTLQNENADRYLATASKAQRAGKIYVDYLRNARGSTAIASYSTRARAGATVAIPLRWGELSAGLDPASFNLETVPRRLARVRTDPWNGFFDVKQSISGRLIAKFSES
jgi:bifunctional non-homologous end joining protein LigD